VKNYRLRWPIDPEKSHPQGRVDVVDVGQCASRMALSSRNSGLQIVAFVEAV